MASAGADSTSSTAECLSTESSAPEFCSANRSDAERKVEAQNNTCINPSSWQMTYMETFRRNALMPSTECFNATLELEVDLDPEGGCFRDALAAT
jgi:hypothetical protein